MPELVVKSKGDQRAAQNWANVRELIRKGFCRTCRKKRGKTGTKQHCRLCADDHNAESRGRYRAMSDALRAKRAV